MSIYSSVNNLSTILSKIYVSVNDLSKQVLKVYTGVNGKSVLVYEYKTNNNNNDNGSNNENDKLYLYNNGDECIDTTGGWKIYEYENHNAIGGIFEKQPDCLHIGISGLSGTCINKGFCPQNNLDLSNYTKMYINYSYYANSTRHNFNIWMEDESTQSVQGLTTTNATIDTEKYNTSFAWLSNDRENTMIFFQYSENIFSLEDFVAEIKIKEIWLE